MKNISLSHIIIITCTFGILFLMGIIFFGIDSWKDSIVERRIDERIELASMINESLFSPAVQFRTALWHGLDIILLRGISRIDDVNYVQIVGDDGKVSSSSLPSVLTPTEEVFIGVKRSLSTNRVQVQDDFINGERVKRIIYPGYDNNAVVLVTSIESILQETEEWARMTYLGAFSILLFVYGFLLIVLYRFISVPIKRMAEEHTKIGKGEIEEASLEMRGPKEIKNIASSFNNMVSSLKDYKKETEETKNILEIKVNARTKELKEVNKRLEEEVRKRTISLERKIKEYEKVNKLMTGRELRMIELKKEMEKQKKIIKRLKEKLGE